MQRSRRVWQLFIIFQGVLGWGLGVWQPGRVAARAMDSLGVFTVPTEMPVDGQDMYMDAPARATSRVQVVQTYRALLQFLGTSALPFSRGDDAKPSSSASVRVSPTLPVPSPPSATQEAQIVRSPPTDSADRMPLSPDVGRSPMLPSADSPPNNRQISGSNLPPPTEMSSPTYTASPPPSPTPSPPQQVPFSFDASPAYASPAQQPSDSPAGRFAKSAIEAIEPRALRLSEGASPPPTANREGMPPAASSAIATPTFLVVDPQRPPPPPASLATRFAELTPTTVQQTGESWKPNLT
jgi:hypothetical protein